MKTVQHKTHPRLSLVAIVKNEEKQISSFIENVRWSDEIIIIDNNSVDNTYFLANNFTNKVYRSAEKNIGKIKTFALSKASGKWILFLDADERVSGVLKEEILSLVKGNSAMSGYKINYINHFLGHKLNSKAQQYGKVRLFKKNCGSISQNQVHEEIEIEGEVGELKGKIYHYSFRSIGQTLRKFTYYAKSEAPVLFEKGERVTLKKLTMYPAHMFWAIFFKDEGWKDGIWGFGLAICFTYYEFARYFYLLLEEKKKH